MSSEGFLSLVAEGKLESSESIRETLSQCVCFVCLLCVCVRVFVSCMRVCIVAETERKRGMRGKGVTVTTSVRQMESVNIKYKVTN